MTAWRLIWTSAVGLAAVSLITFAAYETFSVNAATAAFAYLLIILIVASTWGFLQAFLASVAATLYLNYFFLPPVGTLTIADPQNWVALFSFLASSLIASRLSAVAKRQTLDAVNRRKDVERLYTFSRAILLIDGGEPFAKQLAQQLAEIFGLDAVVLYDRRADHIYRGGPSEFEGMEQQLKEAALNGTSFQDATRHKVVTAVRLGSEPIASLALQGEPMSDAVLQGIGNLIAIGLERARAQDLAHQVEAAHQTERLRTALIDAMAHEFKTPLTSIKAATTSLLSQPQQPELSRTELLKIADEEADRLKDLIDNALELARLDEAHLDVHAELSDLADAARETIDAMHGSIDGRSVTFTSDPHAPLATFDRRLIKLAIKQIIDNALKYSSPETPVEVRVGVNSEDAAQLEITDHGKGIPTQEQPRIFQRFYRSPAIEKQIPGSGLGLSIAHRILQAHGGDLTVDSEPGATTFRMTLPSVKNQERGPIELGQNSGRR
jgi:two-component system sensor histidine kinase KdpD